MLAPLIGLAMLAAPSSDRGDEPMPAHLQRRDSRSWLARRGLRFGLELGLGVYGPQVDDEFSNATPYRDIFGGDSALMGHFRLHSFFDTALGEIGLTAGVGWFTDEGRNLDDEGQRTAGRSSIRLIPLTLLVRWRIPGLDRVVGLPLAVHVAGGVNYSLWRVTRTDGEVATADGTTGEGATLSPQVEGGLGLRLGELDRTSARRLFRSFGISDSEIGIAVSYTGEPIAWTSLAVGDLTWRGYLLLNF